MLSGSIWNTILNYLAGDLPTPAIINILQSKHFNYDNLSYLTVPIDYITQNNWNSINWTFLSRNTDLIQSIPLSEIKHIFFPELLSEPDCPYNFISPYVSEAFVTLFPEIWAHESF